MGRPSPIPRLPLDFSEGDFLPSARDFRPATGETLVLALDDRRPYRVLVGRAFRRCAYLLESPGRAPEVHTLRSLAAAILEAELAVADEARSRRAKQWQARQSRRVWMGGGR